MTPETLEALKGSIEKWRKIVEENGKDEGTANCPLCQLFWTPDEDCGACPVAEEVGTWGCHGTPYYRFADIAEGGCATTPKANLAAHAMLDFLRSLLPKEEGE